jgi:hypothetical protein
LPVFKKPGWEAYPQPIEGVSAVLGRKTKGRCEPQHNYLYIHMLFQNKSIKRERKRERVRLRLTYI